MDEWSTPQLLVVGHVTQDLTPEGPRLGGAAYAALTASRLGLRTALVTSAGAELDASAHLPGVAVHQVPASATTVFENQYTRGRRSQTVRSMAAPLALEHIPTNWHRTPVVFLAPVAQEISPLLISAFPQALVGVQLQGWLRRWDSEGHVEIAPWEPEAGALEHLDLAVLSTEELPGHRWLNRLAKMVRLVALTHGRKGSSLYVDGVLHKVPAFPRKEIDPTGAGDVYAAAFLVRYWETGHPWDAAIFASCAASFCVEAPGIEGVPNRYQVEARLREAGY